MIYSQFTKMCDFFDCLSWAQSAFNRKHTQNPVNRRQVETWQSRIIMSFGKMSRRDEETGIERAFFSSGQDVARQVR